MSERRDLTADERAAAAARLRTVGGLYDYIAAFVERDDSRPAPSTLRP